MWVRRTSRPIPPRWSTHTQGLIGSTCKRCAKSMTLTNFSTHTWACSDATRTKQGATACCGRDEPMTTWLREWLLRRELLRICRTPSDGSSSLKYAVRGDPYGRCVVAPAPDLLGRETMV